MRHPLERNHNSHTTFSSGSKIAFGYRLGANGTPIFATVLNGVIFRIEEIAITNDLVETVVPFYALGDCEAGYEATEIGGAYSIGSSLPSAGAFGGPTSPRFPQFRIDG